MNRRYPLKAYLAPLLFAILTAGSGLAQATGDYDAGARKSLYCSYCHGYDGNPLDAKVPRLAGQPAEYIVNRLKELRKNGAMHESMLQAIQTADLNDADIANLAAFFARQPVRRQ